MPPQMHSYGVIYSEGCLKSRARHTNLQDLTQQLGQLYACTAKGTLMGVCTVTVFQHQFCIAVIVVRLIVKHSGYSLIGRKVMAKLKFTTLL